MPGARYQVRCGAKMVNRAAFQTSHNPADCTKMHRLHSMVRAREELDLSGRVRAESGV